MKKVFAILFFIFSGFLLLLSAVILSIPTTSYILPIIMIPLALILIYLGITFLVRQKRSVVNHEQYITDISRWYNEYIPVPMIPNGIILKPGETC